MAASFDCPKCGAPVKYSSVEQGYLETITCPYCGESIVIPVGMRGKPPAANPVNKSSVADQLNSLDPGDRQEFEQLLKEVEEKKTSPTPDWQKEDARIASQNKMFKRIGTAGTIIGLVVAALALIPVVIMGCVALYAAISPAFSSSAKTAAGNVTATRTAQSAVFSVQNNWPMLIQDGFTNNKYNWTTGTDNNDRALEQKTLTGGKYIWEFTSKHNVCEISFPDMPVQKDLLVSLDVQITSTSHSPDDKAGIVFRHTASKPSFYFFGLSPNGGFFLSMFDGSSWHNLIDPTTSAAIKSNQVNQIAVSMAGSQILLEINNQVVGDYQDDSLTSGDAGVGLNLSDAGIDAKATFSKFYVKAPKE